MQVKSLLQNAPRKHAAILLTFIKLPVVYVVLSIFEWPLKTGSNELAMAGRQVDLSSPENIV